MRSLETAIIMATTYHAGQKDLAGNAYILHLLRVMLSLTDPVDKIVGVFHDSLEDAPDEVQAECRRKDIERFFGKEVLATISLLTHAHGLSSEDYLKVYIPGILTDPRAVRVKLADLEDNMSPARMRFTSEKDVHRLRKYIRARRILAPEN